jgi:phosphate transport system substrate-binding protein
VATSVLGACRRAPISTSAVITIDGSSTVYPLAEALAEDFRLGEPATRVTIGVAGTGGGLRRFCRGELDLATASRPITRQEAAACEASGVRFVELPLAYDGIVIAVHPSNHWVEALSVADLARLWQHEAQGRIVRWAQWKPGYPEREIHLFGAGVDSGTFDYFTGVVTGAPRDSRGDYTSSEDDNMLVQGVATDPDALGYFGFAYYEAHQEYLRAVPIRAQDGMPAVLPTRESIRTGVYRPLARPVYVYANADALQRPEVRRLLEYGMTHGPDLAEDVGYVPLSADEQARAVERLAARRTGSAVLEARAVERARS